MPDQPNIAVVVLDTLRKDYFEEHFDWLISDSYYFDNAWSTSDWTVPSHASLFTGYYPSEVGVHEKNPYLNCEERTIAEELKENNYQTTGLVANTAIKSHFNFDRGFDKYIEVKNKADWSSEIRKNIEPKIFDNKYLDYIYNSIKSQNTLDLIKNGVDMSLFNGFNIDDGASEIIHRLRSLNFGDREFLFLNLMEAHSPYSPPWRYRETGVVSLSSFGTTAFSGPDTNLDVIESSYSDAVRYLSKKYKTIHHILDRSFDYIFVLSDHGEAFGEYNSWGHRCDLPPEVTNIPISVSGFPNLNGKSCSIPLNLINVYEFIHQLNINGSYHVEQIMEKPNESKVRLLTETNGLKDSELQSATARESELLKPVNVLDSPRYGIVSETGYDFQSLFKGMVSMSELSDPDGKIVQKFDNLVDGKVQERKADVPDEIKSRLEELGYY
jgi:arylsulfatase